MSELITIKELNTHEEMLQGFAVIRQRYLGMSLETYSVQIAEMMKLNDFKMIGAFLGDEIVGISGYSLLHLLYCGRFLQISSFIVDENKRSLGVGKKILAKIEELGKKLKCDKIVLDSYIENKKSHPLYFREGFHIRGFHFMKDL